MAVDFKALKLYSTAKNKHKSGFYNRVFKLFGGEQLSFG